MILYNFATAPNGLRVNIFVREKGLTIPTKNVNLLKLENHSEEIQALNPAGTVPFLKLDNIVITESMAICRYLEARYPDVPMFGIEPEEQGIIEAIRRRVEFEGLLMVSDQLRNSSPFFKDRALPGKKGVPQIAELAERGAKQVNKFLEWVDEHLSNNEYMAGDKFSIADIDTYVTIDTMKMIKVYPDQQNITQWMTRMQQRPAFNKD